MTVRVKMKKAVLPRTGGVLNLVAIGRRIRELRGFETRQSEFANILGVSQSVLSKYERGAVEPSLEAVVRLCQRFGKSLDWLVLGK